MSEGNDGRGGISLQKKVFIVFRLFICRKVLHLREQDQPPDVKRKARGRHWRGRASLSFISHHSSSNLPCYGQRRITQARIATTRDNQISTVATTEPACAGWFPMAIILIAIQISAPAMIALSKFFIDLINRQSASGRDRARNRSALFSVSDFSVSVFGVSESLCSGSL